MSIPIKKILCVSVVSLLLSGCYQAQYDDDLRTVPTTNNPNIVPSAGLSNLSAFGL